MAQYPLPEDTAALQERLVPIAAADTGATAEAGHLRRLHIGLRDRFPAQAAALIGEQLGLPVPAEWLERGRRLHEQMLREVLQG